MSDITKLDWVSLYEDGTPFFWGVNYSSAVIFTDTHLYLGYTTDFVKHEDFYQVVFDNVMDWYDITHDEWTFVATINAIIHRFVYAFSLTSNVVLHVWNPKTKKFERTNWKAILAEKT